MKQKAFFIIFKRLSLKQIKQLFLEGEGLTLRRNRFQKTSQGSNSLWGSVTSMNNVNVQIQFKRKR